MELFSMMGLKLIHVNKRDPRILNYPQRLPVFHVQRHAASSLGACNTIKVTKNYGSIGKRWLVIGAAADFVDNYISNVGVTSKNGLLIPSIFCSLNVVLIARKHINCY